MTTFSKQWLGNLVLSINLLLCIILGLIVIRKDQLTWRFKQSYWLLIAFFLYLFLLTAIQFSDYAVWTETAVKSFLENPEAISFHGNRYFTAQWKQFI